MGNVPTLAACVKNKSNRSDEKVRLASSLASGDSLCAAVGVGAKTSTASQPYFVLKAANQQVIGKSEMYSSETAAKNGIASVQKNCISTEIKDVA